LELYKPTYLKREGIKTETGYESYKENWSKALLEEHWQYVESLITKEEKRLE
jgi:hypothetical protein